MTVKCFPGGGALPAASGVARPTRCGDSVFKYVILNNYQSSGNSTFHPVCIDYYRRHSIICTYLASLLIVKGAKPAAYRRLWQRDLLINNMQTLGDNMRTFRMYSLALTIFFGLMASGCAPMVITGAADVDKKAFGAKKRFAVVSIASMKTFQGQQGITQMFKSNDDIPGTNSQPLINAVKPKIISSLKNSGHFTLLPESAVLSSKAYKNIQEDERVQKVLFFGEGINVAS